MNKFIVYQNTFILNIHFQAVNQTLKVNHIQAFIRAVSSVDVLLLSQADVLQRISWI
jgi:hypothetical protein